MKRILLDTSVYGEMVIDADIDAIKGSITKSVAVYGCRLVRNQLRATSKSKFVGDHGLRISLLNLYDGIAKREYEITNEMKQMAEFYYKAYREFGGSKGLEFIIEDFIIVACAAVHNIDIVVSEDEKSMLTENAIRAYKLVNELLKKRTPEFIGYEEFKQLLGGS